MSERKRYSRRDMAVIIVCLMIIFTGTGYGWRMHHETKEIQNKIDPTGTIYLADLSMEIGKGKEFWLPVDDDTMLHFLPLRGARFEMAVRREKR